MGNFMGKALDESFNKNKKFMIEMQSIQLERQIHMQDQMRQRMQALQVARARELFYWWAAFYTVGLVGAVAVARRTGRRTALFPFFPLTFIVGYQADLAYGNKLERIRAEAEHIMRSETELLEPPCGVPTTSGIDAARHKLSDEQRLNLRRPPCPICC
ncbi:plasminogen receptor (KT)-like isoform X3 [Amphibalanus amphitrite]|uniref:plasminogen receptor (KT)-like isoform X3 n=1 Tax=Amphibalanus amphitrite TaxID=1232801 RepID=UPI001C904901|nr:plasminogen receptor (KT)-like isoform X3 [Amphibalanus amphitrite]XP_043225039.1 plasminogen receptor (KT)-like isoform X3 [Amphibalanus amphitrite]XP_043225040.1 plasminogen receptor (KT)-like isoform X3 [Amphibalanus amphitrite]